MSDTQFRLSCELRGHEQDVRALAATEDGKITSASRDCSIRVWSPVDGSYVEACILRGHSHFVGAVLPTAGLSGEGLTLASGSHDKHVMLWDVSKGEATAAMEGHTDAITCLSMSAAGQLISGSWDKTVRVWADGACVEELKGHGAAVWDVLGLPSGEILSASADKTIKLWQNGECTKTYTGHTDVVRGLSLVDNIGFLSASNDGTMRLWSLAGECLQTIECGEWFIYSNCVTASGQFVSCSEDRTVKIWQGAECVQTITHPATVWDLCTLPNGDLVTGCADGVVRVWTFSSDRFADAETITMFEDQVSAVSINAQSVGGVDTKNLASMDALQTPGEKEGQYKIVKNVRGQPEIYTWSMADARWSKIGDVVDGPGGGQPMGKQELNGKQYDFVFDVDIVEGAPPLKLGYNSGDNPYMAAQTFLFDNELDQAFLDQVAQFIITNTPNAPVTQDATAVDPFTGGGRYIPGSATTSTVNPPASGADFVDPMTGGSAYRSGTGVQTGSTRGFEDPLSSSRYRPADAPAVTYPGSDVAVQPVKKTLLPAVVMLVFDAAKLDAIHKKIMQFNEELAADPGSSSMVLQPDAITSLSNLMKTLKQTSLYHNTKVPAEEFAVIDKMLMWPVERQFPALDVLRLLALHPSTAEHYTEKSGLVDTLLTRCSLDGPIPNCMMASRTLANLFWHKQSRTLVAAKASVVVDAMVDVVKALEQKAQLRLGAVTVLFNLVVHLKEQPDEGLFTQCLSLLLESVKQETDPEVLFRALMALGTVLETEPGQRAVARQMDVLSLLEMTKSNEVDKIKKVTAEIVALVNG